MTRTPLLAFIRKSDPEARMLNDYTVAITRAVELPNNSVIDGNNLTACVPSKPTTKERAAQVRRRNRQQNREEAIPAHPPRLPENARDFVPSPLTGWIRMRQGEHFSQWCKGAACVKLRTTQYLDSVTHFVDITEVGPRRQREILSAFGLGDAVKVKETDGSARFKLEVSRRDV